MRGEPLEQARTTAPLRRPAATPPTSLVAPAVALAVALGALLPACGAPTLVDLRRPASAAPTAQAPVVVAIDADAGLAETPGGPEVRRDLAGKHNRGTFVARWIDRRGDWLLVEPITSSHDPGARCSQPMFRLDGLELGVWVKASAAAPMVSKRTRASWKDGTSVTLESSTVLRPIERLDASRAVYEVRMDDFAFRSIVPDTMVAIAASPGPGWEDETDALVDDKAPLTFGGGARVVPQHNYGRFAVRRVGQVENGELVRLRLRCAEIVGIVPFGTVKPYGGGGLGVLGSASDGPPKEWVRAGTPLFWSSGQRAGRTTRTVQLRHEVQAPSDRLRCFRRPLRWLSSGEEPRAEESLLLCVDAAQVQPVETLATEGKDAPAR